MPKKHGEREKKPSAFLEPQRGAEAVGDGGAVLLGQGPGVLGDGDLGEAEHGARLVNRKRASSAAAPCSVTVMVARKPKRLGDGGDVGAAGA